MIGRIGAIGSAAVVCLGFLLSVSATAAAGAPGPIATPVPGAGCITPAVICLDDQNGAPPGQPPRVFHASVGQTVEVALRARSVVGPFTGWNWSSSSSDPTVLGPIKQTAGDAPIYRADYLSVSAGQASVVAVGQFTCATSCPPGPITQVTWTVVVGPGSTSPTPVPPACAPTADVCLTAQNAARGDPLSATFVVKVGTVIQVALAGQGLTPGIGLRWQTSSYDPTVVAPQGVAGQGFYLATFKAIANGTSTLTALGTMACPIPCPGPVIRLQWVIAVGGPATPEAPTHLVVLVNGGGHVSLSFDPPGTGADAYAVYGYSYPSQATVFQVVPGNATPTLSGLTAGQLFTFTVIAHNRNGWGRWAAWAPWVTIT